MKKYILVAKEPSQSSLSRFPTVSEMASFLMPLPLRLDSFFDPLKHIYIHIHIIFILEMYVFTHATHTDCIALIYRPFGKKQALGTLDTSFLLACSCKNLHTILSSLRRFQSSERSHDWRLLDKRKALWDSWFLKTASCITLI